VKEFKIWLVAEKMGNQGLDLAPKYELIDLKLVIWKLVS
jgi:hypothetical protein